MNTDAVSTFSRVERRGHALDRVLARIAAQLRASEARATGIFEPLDMLMAACLPMMAQTGESGKRFYGPTTTFSEGDQTFEITTWTDLHGHWLLGKRMCERRQYPRLLVKREPKEGLFDEADVAALVPTLPHMVDYFALHHDFDTLRAETAHITSTLDYLPMAIMLLDEELKIIAANSPASRILAAGDGLSQKNGFLSLKRSEADQLRGAIAAKREIECYVERTSPKAPYVVRVISTTRKRNSPVVFATLTIRDSGAAPVTNSPLLSKVFGLTRAEAKLAQELVCGASLPDAAKNLGVSHNTVRTHMKRIFEKTGLNRQADLIRLLSGMLSEA